VQESAEIKPNYQTVEGLKQHPLYLLLTDKQQKFVLAYIELKGDRVEAARVAYGGKKPQLAAIRALNTAYIRDLLATFYGYKQDLVPMGKQELKTLIAARLRKGTCSDGTFGRLTDHLIELSGWGRSKRNAGLGRPPESERETIAVESIPEVDALVRQIEAAKKQKDNNNG
jgi:hypothetical protein